MKRFVEAKKEDHITVEEEGIKFLIPEDENAGSGLIRYEKGDPGKLRYLPFEKIDEFSVEERKWIKIIGILIALGVVLGGADSLCIFRWFFGVSILHLLLPVIKS